MGYFMVLRCAEKRLITVYGCVITSCMMNYLAYNRRVWEQL